VNLSNPAPQPIGQQAEGPGRIRPEGFHVGESCPFADGPAVAPISLGQRRRADALGWRFTSLDADLSPERQVEQLDELVRLEVDALTTWTLDPELAEPAYARAKAAGIPIVGFSSESASLTTVIRQRADSELPASDVAAYIAERVRAARVLVVGGPPIPALAARVELFLEAAARAGLRIAGRDDNVGDIEATARPVVEGLLDRHSEVDAIWCFNDHTAVAAGKVLRARGLPVWSGDRRGVIVSGISGAPAAIAAIRAGEVTLTYDSLPLDAGRAAIDVLEALLARGEEPPEAVWIDCRRYDSSNIDSFVPWEARE
jgi:ribose transport system substrate-binding protein